jgi:flagellar hook protein FlgE
MSIWTSLYTGSSGIEAHGNGISVVGDNIANVSTIGYKASRASFQDLLGGSAPNGQRIGAGVRMGGVDVRFGQGSLQQTGNPLDMAVNGNGFFMLAGCRATSSAPTARRRRRRATWCSRRRARRSRPPTSRWRSTSTARPAS